MYPFPSMHKGLFMFLRIPCLPQIISAYFPLNLMPRNSVIGAAEYLAYLSWKSSLWNEPERTVFQPYEKNNPLQTLLGKLKMWTPINIMK